jgi:predicted nucleic acid-binding protein
MIVVADTSPISYLILIGEVNLLPELYETVLIPGGVLSELTSDGAPEVVKGWFDDQPSWLLTRELKEALDPGLIKMLDRGEVEAIQLARELNADLVLIDELKGRRIAVEYGLRVTGLIGVLAAAGIRGIIDIEDAIAKLLKTKFFVSEDLIRFLRNIETKQ